VTTTSPLDAELYDEFNVGDEVYCLAWIGMPFVVVGKNDEKRAIEIDGTGPCSLPEGARIDLSPENHFMLTHEHWDQLWYWPDIAGETYLDVAERFVESHHTDEVVNGYAAGMVWVVNEPDRAMAFRLDLDTWTHFGQVNAQPVAALGQDLTVVLDAAADVSSDRWVATGPTVALELRMVAYRWSLTFGKFVLNWQDFD
jgi:hypothetical protein